MKTKQENNKDIIHKSVLVDEVLHYINLEPNKVYLDVTFGSGGHTKAILDKEPKCKVIALDWDRISIEKYAPPLQEKYGNRLKVLWGNFALIYRILKKENIKSVDGILADFGTSKYQILEREGFSFQKDTPLDMRMSKAHHYFSATHVVNKYSAKHLMKIFSEFGEERYSKKIANVIVERRALKKITTTKQLADLISSVVPAPKTPRKKKRIHPATRVFQALRIYVNKELENIKNFLFSATELLNVGGRFICISFHSLEDRCVKEFFKSKVDTLKIITKKPIIPQPSEVAENPSSRSAKLRVAEKISTPLS